MRILFVTPRIPSPLRGRRAYDLVRYLSRRHELCLLSFRGVEKEDPNLAMQRVKGCFRKSWLVPISYTQGVTRAALRLFTATPLRVAFFRSRQMKKMVTRILREEEFDLAYVKRVQMAQYFDNFDCIPKIVDLTDCLTLYYQTMLDARQGAIQKLVNIEELHKMRAYERWVVEHFPKVTVCSEKDRETLRSLSPSGEKVRVVPNGIDTEYFVPAELPVDPHSLLFVGHMSYPPNLDGMLYFVDHALPVIRREIPDCRVDVVGPKPHSSLRRLEALGNIRILGFVPDVRPYLARAAVVICPVRTGAGMKNKILEAMAMGKPMVATRESLSGINAKPGAEVMVADSAEEFASHVIRILDNPRLGNDIGTAGRQLIQRSYSLDSVIDQLEGILNECVEEKARPGVTVH